MQQGTASNLHPVTASFPAPRAITWRRTPMGSGLVKVRSMSNGSAADSLDHLQRASTTKATRQQQQQQHRGSSAPRPRRVVQTTPFGLWDSFPEARTLDQMVRTMERIMDGEDDDDGRVLFVPAAATALPRAGNGGGVAAAATPSGGYRRGRTPWEVREREGDYLVRFDMPGMTREDVRVSVQDRMLLVLAEKQQPTKQPGEENGAEEEEAWPAASFGRYRTRVELPENVDVERIAAEVRDGVLYLAIPKLSPGGKVVNIQVQ